MDGQCCCRGDSQSLVNISQLRISLKQCMAWSGFKPQLDYIQNPNGSGPSVSIISWPGEVEMMQVC